MSTSDPHAAGPTLADLEHAAAKDGEIHEGWCPACGDVLWVQQSHGKSVLYCAGPGQCREHDIRAAAAAGPSPVLATADTAFRKWLGAAYDLDIVHAMLACAACERLDGTPPWLLIIGGSGGAKTEALMTLAAAGAVVTSTISGPAALLSGSPAREKAKDATGGLLVRLGSRGLLAIKDFTSILTMHREARAALFAALREVHDGYWERNLGVDGARSLSWRGRLVVIGACTSAWDTAYRAIAECGDRFLTIRINLDETAARVQMGRSALKATRQQATMRDALATAVRAVLTAVSPAAAPADLTKAEANVLIKAATLVTRVRSAVEHDPRGWPTEAHLPEQPTRFVQQLAQVVRGGVAIGLPRAAALALALRIARDSMPPLRRTILTDVEAHPNTSVSETTRRVDLPRTTVDRTLQALHLLQVVTLDRDAPADEDGRTGWRYQLAAGITLKVLDPDQTIDDDDDDGGADDDV